jgi:hypothetical protein
MIKRTRIAECDFCPEERALPDSSKLKEPLPCLNRQLDRVHMRRRTVDNKLICNDCMTEDIFDRPIEIGDLLRVRGMKGVWRVKERKYDANIKTDHPVYISIETYNGGPLIENIRPWKTKRLGT